MAIPGGGPGAARQKAARTRLHNATKVSALIEDAGTGIVPVVPTAANARRTGEPAHPETCQLHTA